MLRHLSEYALSLCSCKNLRNYSSKDSKIFKTINYKFETKVYNTINHSSVAVDYNYPATDGNLKLGSIDCDMKSVRYFDEISELGIFKKYINDKYKEIDYNKYSTEFNKVLDLNGIYALQVSIDNQFIGPGLPTPRVFTIPGLTQEEIDKLFAVKISVHKMP